jgi:hypothetical protein
MSSWGLTRTLLNCFEKCVKKYEDMSALAIHDVDLGEDRSVYG